MHGRDAHELPAFQRRLDRQAAALRHLRRPVHERAGLAACDRILDVGCGTGSVTADLREHGTVVAVDVDPAMARRSHEAIGDDVRVLQAEGTALPFPDGHFDAAVCNLVLLWAPRPGALVAEMARVVRPGGVVVASMEPDYGGKIHWPRNPLVDAVFQGEGVARRGGDPHAGRKLRSWFVAAGLVTDVGISNADVPTPADDLANFRHNRRYYRDLLQEAGFDSGQIDGWEEEYVAALDAGIELCFLPMFHAIGRKPGGPLRR